MQPSESRNNPHIIFYLLFALDYFQYVVYARLGLGEAFRNRKKFFAQHPIPGFVVGVRKEHGVSLDTGHNDVSRELDSKELPGLDFSMTPYEVHVERRIKF